MPSPGQKKRKNESVLAEIVASCRERLEVRKANQSVEGMLDSVEPSNRSLQKTLSQSGARFVLEMKRRSPSRGDLRPDATPEDIALAYRGTADAVSVLTEPNFFGGCPEDIGRVRSIFEGPVLQKDFLLDPYQVVEARLYGADAVLLMLSVLADSEAARCLEMCGELGLDALVEVHDQTELDRALALEAPIIGINNRDLATLDVDLTTTERLASQVPADRVLITESGIGSVNDVERLASSVDAFLVGSSLMMEDDLRGAACALISGRFKVCGLTRVEDAITATKAGAWRLGAVLAANSPRCTTVQRAREIAEQTGLDPVAVFRSQPLDEIIRLAQLARAETVQIHHKLSASEIDSMRSQLPGVEIWSVVGVKEDQQLTVIPRTMADRLVLDAQVNGRSGGTGVAFDIKGVAELPGFDQTLVAGGIGAGNARAILDRGPYGIDLSSSLETQPGIKDPQAIRSLHQALRRPCRSDIQTQEGLSV